MRLVQDIWGSSVPRENKNSSRKRREFEITVFDMSSLKQQNRGQKIQGKQDLVRDKCVSV